MFGIVFANQFPRVQGGQHVSNTHVLYSFDGVPVNSRDDSTNFCVFLLPDKRLPAETAAAVYISFPPSKEFHYCGFISNESPSKFFRIFVPPKQREENANDNNNNEVDLQMDEGDEELYYPLPVVIGVAAEPLEPLLQKNMERILIKERISRMIEDAGSRRQVAEPDDYKEFCAAVVQDLQDYAGGFAKRLTYTPPNGPPVNDTWIPTSTLGQWVTKITRKVQLDPFFFKRNKD